MKTLGTGPLSRIVKSAGARVVILPLSGGAALLTTRLVTSEFGVGTYGVFALAASLPFLVPMMDLGVGAAVTNAAAGLPNSSATFRLVFRKAQRTLLVVGSTLAIVALLFGASGLWGRVLNLPDGQQLDWGIAGAVLLVAFAIPGSLGARILLGLRRNALVVLVQGATSVVNLMVVALLFVFEASVPYLIAGSTAGLLVTNWILTFIAFRIGEVHRAKSSNNVDRHVSASIWATAIPMIVVSVALPLTFQSDRIVLGWASGLEQVAIYSGAAMVFLPVLSVVQVAGRSLWGDFAEARHNGWDVRRLFMRSVAVSAGIGCGGAAGLLVLGPFIASWATSGILEIPYSIYAAFAAIVLLQAVQQPSGMYLTDARGLRFQAVSTVATAASSLTLSVLLASKMGAVGPVLASGISLLIFHVIPCLAFALARIRVENGRVREGPMVS